MSVLKSKRELSKTEYLKTLRELEVFIIKRAAKKPRKMDHLFLNDFIQLSKDALNNAVAGYSVIVSCKEDVALVHRYLMLSYAKVQALNSQVGIYYDLYRDYPDGLSQAEMKTLSKLIFDSAHQLTIAIRDNKQRHKHFLKI